MPTNTLKIKAPLEVLYNKPLNLSHLKVFGCLCYVHIPSKKYDKNDPKAERCVFLGYSNVSKGYKCLNPRAKQKFITRDVQFLENIPYFTNSSNNDRGSEFQS